MSCQKEKTPQRVVFWNCPISMFFNCRKKWRPIPITKVALIFHFYQLFSGCNFLYLFELMANQGLHLRKHSKHVLNKLNMFLNVTIYS